MITLKKYWASLIQWIRKIFTRLQNFLFPNREKNELSTLSPFKGLNVKEIKLVRPINRTANITKLNISSLENLNQSFLKNFEDLSSEKINSNYTEIENILKSIPTFRDFFKNLKKNSLNYEVVFPDGVLEKLKSGELAIPKKKDLELCVSFIRDRESKKIVKQVMLKEISESEKLDNLTSSLQNMAILQSLNKITKILEQIEEKLSEIHKEFNNDRIGKIQSGYSRYLEAIQMIDSENKRSAFLKAIDNLDEGRRQLILSSKQKLSNLITGKWEVLIREFTSPSDFGKTQKNFINEIQSELFYIQMSSLVILAVYIELSEPNALIQSIAPYLDYLKELSSDSNIYKINEWGQENFIFRDAIQEIIKSIEKIPGYTQIDNSDYTLMLNQ